MGTGGLGGILGDSSWRQAGRRTRRMLRPPPHGVMLLMTPHHAAGGHFFLSVPDAPQNLDIRVFRGNSTGGRKVPGWNGGQMQGCCEDGQNQAHHSPPLCSYVCPPPPNPVPWQDSLQGHCGFLVTTHCHLRLPPPFPPLLPPHFPRTSLRGFPASSLSPSLPQGD